MRKWLYWFGWAVLIALPIVYALQIYITQDLPRVEVWQWFVLFGTLVLIYFARSRDDVLKHHLV